MFSLFSEVVATSGFPSLRDLDLLVSFWSMNPLLFPCGLRVSQTWEIPARRPVLRKTDSLFAKQVQCHPAGLMGELDDVMHVGQCSLVTGDGVWSRQTGVGTCSPTSNLCTFVQAISVSEFHFLQLENENCKNYLSGLL